jgi:glycosyltransferase involved in cell wall biosynthesis
LVYLSDPLPAARMPGLYAACDCLVLPFRGEGFALPVAEAMACGLPAVVTDAGPVSDYCDGSTAYLVAADRREFPTDRVGELETVGRPWLSEPRPDALVEALRAAANDPSGARTRGRLAAERIRAGWTWDHTARAVEDRLDQVRRRS